jgi:hypothetical protein
MHEQSNRRGRRARPGGRAGIAAITALVLVLGPAEMALAQTIDTLSYWITQTQGISQPHACTANNPNSQTTYFRQYQDVPSACPGLTVYQVAKGNGTGTKLQSGETYYANNGLVNIIEQVVSYPWNPPPECVNAGFTQNCDDTRAFRDDATGSKGIATVPLSFTTGWSYTHPPYHEEAWITGYRVCHSNDLIASVPGSGKQIFMNVGPTLTSFLYDYRGGRHNGPYDVQTIQRHDTWGTNNDEYYYYGRWQNPDTRQWEGLGLVKWEYYVGGVLVNACGSNGQQPCSIPSNFLVDCTSAVPCWSCPP